MLPGWHHLHTRLEPLLHATYKNLKVQWRIPNQQNHACGELMIHVELVTKIYIHIYTHTIYIYIYMLCLYVCVYIYIYIYTHTHIHGVPIRQAKGLPSSCEMFGPLAALAVK